MARMSFSICRSRVKYCSSKCQFLVKAADAYAPTSNLRQARWRRPYRAGSRWCSSTPVQSCQRFSEPPLKRNRKRLALRQLHRRRRLPHFSSLLQRLDRNLDWTLEFPPWGISVRLVGLADKVPPWAFVPSGTWHVVLKYGDC